MSVDNEQSTVIRSKAEHEVGGNRLVRGEDRTDQAALAAPRKRDRIRGQIVGKQCAHRSERFAELSGDTFYAHMSDTEAARNPLFGGRVAHGYFLISAAAGLFVDPPYGPVLGNYGLDNLRFVKPVKPGDSIQVRLTCKEKSLRADKGWGEVAWDTEITNQNGETVAAYNVLTMVSVHAIPDAVKQ